MVNRYVCFSDQHVVIDWTSNTVLLALCGLGIAVAVLLFIWLCIRLRPWDGRKERTYIVTFDDGKSCEVRGYDISQYDGDEHVNGSVWIRGNSSNNEIAYFSDEHVVSVIEKQ